MEDVSDVLGLANHPSISFEITVAADLEVDADPDQLFRVLMNLCRNSAQALDADTDPSIVRRISLMAGRSGSVVTIRIADTGPGVPDLARENLFKAFQGGGPSRRDWPGSWQFARSLSARTRGSIDLVSAGQGATFEITIPDRVIELKRGPSQRIGRLIHRPSMEWSGRVTRQKN